MWTYLTEGDGLAALQRVDRPRPTLGTTEILVRMTAISLNYRDLLVIEGVEGWRPREPRVPISDGVGVVEAVGPGVTRVQMGDRVAGIFLPQWQDGELTAANYRLALGGLEADGVLMEYRLFDEQTVVTVPDFLSDTEAACLPVAAITAWHAVRYRSRVQPGDTVLIEGTGGVSLFALLFVHALGARAIVLSSQDAKLERARELGATHVVNYRSTPDWEQDVLALTDGQGVDHVVEVVGGENLNRALRAVRVSGTISFIGLLAGLSAPVNTYEFVTRNVRIHGIETGSRTMFETMNQFLAEHAIHPVLDQVMPLSDLPSALQRVKSGGQFGKVCVAL